MFIVLQRSIGCVRIWNSQLTISPSSTATVPGASCASRCSGSFPAVVLRGVPLAAVVGEVGISVVRGVGISLSFAAAGSAVRRCPLAAGAVVLRPAGAAVFSAAACVSPPVADFFSSVAGSAAGASIAGGAVVLRPAGAASFSAAGCVFPPAANFLSSAAGCWALVRVVSGSCSFFVPVLFYFS